MKISTTKVGGFDVMTLEGEFLSEPEQNAFRTSVRELVDHGSRHLVVDLGRIRHINSCGLGSMVCAHILLRRHGGDVRFAGLNRDVGDLLRITHLDTVFSLYPDVPEATGASPGPRG